MIELPSGKLYHQNPTVSSADPAGRSLLAEVGASSGTSLRTLLTASRVPRGPSFPKQEGRHRGGSRLPRVTEQVCGPWASWLYTPCLLPLWSEAELKSTHPR